MDYNMAISYIKSKTDIVPKLGIILGSGLGEASELVDNAVYIAYDDIPDFPVSTVKGHAGRFVIGYINDVPVILMQGRVHMYEGYSPSDVVIPVRVMGLMGIDTLIITNAAGGISDKLCVGDIMIIEDHISSFISSPLIGPNDERFGTRFPDMTHVYDKEYINTLKNIYSELSLQTNTGVYVQVRGPQYETPAEIRMLRQLGADAVGMSTVCEAIAARHMNIRVVGLSSICNMAAGISNMLSHDDIMNMSNNLSDKLSCIIMKFIEVYKRS